MASVSGIGTVITGTFIDRFRGLAQKAGQTSGSGKNSGATVHDGLRFGAKTYTTAIKNLNSGIAFLNLAEDTLLKLQKVTKSMVQVAEQAARGNSGVSTRSDLDSKLRTLGGQFRDIVSKANVDGRDFLSTEGLGEIFKLIGLDNTTSQSVAKLFEQFVIPDKDKKLASEYEKGSRPVVLQGGVQNGPAADAAYVLEKLSTSGVVTSGEISTAGAVVQQPDTVLNQNPSNQSAIIYSKDGTAVSLKKSQLTADVEVVAVNHTNGYFAIASTQNFLGTNPNGIRQVYLVDTSGTVVSQMTSETKADAVLSDFNLSADNSTLGYIRQYYNPTLSLMTYQVKKNNSIVDSATWQFADDGSCISSLKMSADGNGFVYHYAVGDENNPGILTEENRVNVGGTIDTIASPVDIGNWGWISNTSLAVTSDINVFRYDFGNGDISDVLASSPTGDIYTGITTLQSSSGEGFFMTWNNDGSADYLSLYQAGNENSLQRYDVGNGDYVSQISLAFDYNQPTKVNMGFVGVLKSAAGDSGSQLYRYAANSRATTGQKYARDTEEFDKIFDSGNNIRSRGSAARVYTDLKALDDQITANLKAIANAREVVGQNIELARATGLAFLDVADRIRSDAKAEDVAVMLRDQIRANAKGALAQAENLEPITVAALAMSQSSSSSSK